MNGPLGPLTMAIVPAVVAAALKDKAIPTRTIIAAFLFGAMVYGLYEVNAQIAVAFAWVAALTSLLVNGPTVFQAVGRIG